MSPPKKSPTVDLHTKYLRANAAWGQSKADVAELELKLELARQKAEQLERDCVAAFQAVRAESQARAEVSDD